MEFPASHELDHPTQLLRVPLCSSKVIDHIRVGSSSEIIPEDTSVEVCQHLSLHISRPYVSFSVLDVKMTVI